MRSWLILAIVMLTGSLAAAADPPLVIHEWGTFTSLQNEKGEAIGWINTDDEPVPDFVHTLDGSAVYGRPSRPERFATAGTNDAPTQPFTKGLGALHPDATMRLETPVIYFHRPRGADQPLKLDLSVEFHGGYLTQFYPNADSSNAKVFDGKYWTRITADTVHALHWTGLQIGGGKATGPATDAKVWMTPREVAADAVRTAGGESETFLFYRGVGHLDSPLRVVEDGGNLRLSGELVIQPPMYHMALGKAWLVDIRAPGVVAFKEREELNAPAPPDGSVYGFRPFERKDYAFDPLAKLKAAMHAALIEQGLFDDEASAMLRTWELSYFNSPGLRVFYIVPPAWTEKVLPLKVSVPADIKRVMIGRIELVTLRQRALLANLKGDDVPELGRFAGALMNDVQRRSPSPQMAYLIHQWLFEPAQIAK